MTTKTSVLQAESPTFHEETPVQPVYVNKVIVHDDAGFVAVEHGVFNFVGAVGFAFAIGRGHDEGLQHFSAGQVLQDQAFLHVFGHIAAHVLEGVGGHIGYAAIGIDVNLVFEFEIVD